MIDLTQYKELMKCKKQMKKIEKECEKLVNKEKKINFEKAMEKYDEIYKPYKKYIHTTFAETVFNLLTQLNPKLIEHRTGKKLKFNEVFGDDFNKLNESMVIHLYKLANETSAIYKYEDEVKRLDEKILKGGDYLKPCEIGFETPVWRNGEELECSYQYGLPIEVWKQISYEEKVKNDEMFESLSQRERAEYMNKTYKMKYKLKNYSNEKPQEK